MTGANDDGSTAGPDPDRQRRIDRRRLLRVGSLVAVGGWALGSTGGCDAVRDALRDRRPLHLPPPVDAPDVRARVDRAWERIESFPFPAGGFAQRLAPGATDASIEKLERALRFRLPPDVRASLRRHDGERPARTIDEVGAVFGTMDLQSCDGIRSNWQASVSVPAWDRPGTNDARIKPAYWYRRSWVPMLVSVDGDSHYLVDTDPGPAGQVGQVLSWNGGDRIWVQRSWADLLELTADLLEAVPYKFSDGVWLFDGQFDLGSYAGFGGSRRWTRRA